MDATDVSGKTIEPEHSNLFVGNLHKVAIRCVVRLRDRLGCRESGCWETIFRAVLEEGFPTSSSATLVRWDELHHCGCFMNNPGDIFRVFRHHPRFLMWDCLDHSGIPPKSKGLSGLFSIFPIFGLGFPYFSSETVNAQRIPVIWTAFFRTPRRRNCLRLGGTWGTRIRCNYHYITIIVLLMYVTILMLLYDVAIMMWLPFLIATTYISSTRHLSVIVNWLLVLIVSCCFFLQPLGWKPGRLKAGWKGRNCM